MPFEWCIKICFSIRSVRCFIIFLIIIITITHTLLRLLPLWDELKIKMVVDDKWHEYLSIDASYVWYFDRYVIYNTLITIIANSHELLHLFLTISTNIDDIGFGTIGDNRWHYEPLKWCIICLSTRSVRYFTAFSIIIITITH